MKYPLRVVYSPAVADRYAVADAGGKIICRFMDDAWDRELAERFVRSANRWRWWSLIRWCWLRLSPCLIQPL